MRGPIVAGEQTWALPILAEVGVLSVTVAVQLAGLPTGTVSGAQLTTVLVACLFAVNTSLPPLRRFIVCRLLLPLKVCAPTTAGAHLTPQRVLPAPRTASVLP